MAGSPSFEELLSEGDSVSVEGWDFSWFRGRATEERPSWGYSRMMVQRMATVAAALDIQTALPFRTESFDLVVSRHPTVAIWDEIARVLKPGR